MAKIFDIDFRKGTLIDSVSGIAGTNTNGVFKQTEKGLSWLGVKLNAYLTLNNTVNLGTIFSFECVVKITHNSYSWQALAGQSNGSYPCTLKPNDNAIYINDGTNYDFEIRADLFDGTYHHLIIVKNNTSAFIYVDNIVGSELSFATSIPINITSLFERQSTLRFREYCNLVRIYNHVLTSQERSKLYQQFLKSAPIYTPNENVKGKVKASNLSNENGLVAAYNMQPTVGGILPDISGNGRHATLYGGLTNKEGLIFDDSKKEYALLNNTTGNYSKYTILIRVKMNDYSTTQNFLAGSSTDSSSYYISQSGGRIAWFNGVAWMNGNIYFYDQWVTIALIFDYNNGNRIWKSYINGEEDFINEGVGNLNSGNFKTLFSLTSTTRNSDAIYKDLRIYSRELSVSEIQIYHNSFASQVYLYEDFSNAPADGTNILPVNWIAGTGVFKIGEITTDSDLHNVGQKYLECVTAGTLAIPSKQAYGTCEFNLYIYFISDKINFVNGYQFVFDSSERIWLLEKIDGGAYSKMYTNASYASNTTWYKIKITRSLSGEFTYYIKGGNFGNEYILVDVTGGFGTNPITDNTYTTSNFYVLDLDAGDRITNIKMTDGIIV